MERVIFHIDMNCFFASCHQIEDPSLLKQPIVVGHNVKRGIVVTASYEARAFGIKAGMPIYKAKLLCANLKIIDSNFSLYVKYASLLFEFLAQNYTKQIEVASIDECYLDVTDVWSKFGTVRKLAENMQQRVYQELGLPNSIGISQNKFLAKMASDMRKPMGITTLLRNQIQDLIWPLNVGEMYGVGKSLRQILEAEGITTIGQLANYPDPEALIKRHGKVMVGLLANAHGRGNDIINLDHNQLQSINNELTFQEDVDDYEILKQNLLLLSRHIANRASKRLLKGDVVGVCLKYNRLQRRSKQRKLAKFTNDPDVIYTQALVLFDQLWTGEPVRLIGVFLNNIYYKYDLLEQVSMTDLATLEQNPISKVQQFIDEVNHQCKQKILLTGSELLEREFLNQKQTKYIQSDRVKPLKLEEELNSGNKPRR